MMITVLFSILLADLPGFVAGEDPREDSIIASLETMQYQWYERLARFDDEDEEAPPGPPGGWPHTTSFSTDLPQQLDYNHGIEENMYVQYQEDYFAAYGGKQAHGIHQHQIARPEGSTTGYYTGVTHFQHVYNPHLVTFLFSAGRHDGGSNTYFTIDTSSEGNPFDGVQESFIDEDDVSPWTWVSAYTVKDPDGPAHHYALFSGGSGSEGVGPSKLYIFEERLDGTLEFPPHVEWVEDIDFTYGSARNCLLADLGDLYDGGGNQVSIQGLPDVIITGTGGLYIFSSLGDGIWQHYRSILIRNLSDDTSAFTGVEVLGNYLIITARARWSTNEGEIFDAPCLVYDYQSDEIVQKFSSNGQTLSVAMLDGKSHVLIGAGGQASYTGQPNLLFDVGVHYEEEGQMRFLKDNDKKKKEEEQKKGKEKEPEPEPEDQILSLSYPQLTLEMPLSYTVYKYVDPTPVSSIPSPGNTRTRQVVPFSINKNPSQMNDDVDLILEINSAQTCNIYYRKTEGEPASVVLPLPGSEGVYNSEIAMYARAGDTLIVRDQLYVILALYNGNNTVYSFNSTEVFLE